MRQTTRMMVLALLTVGCKRGEPSNPPPAPAPPVARPAPINDRDVGVGDAGGDGGTASPWSVTATSHRGMTGDIFTQECPPGGTLAPVWGTDVYSDDSSICSAAVHAGRLTITAGGPMLVFVQPGRTSYAGTTQHGVTSQSRGASPGSFSFSQMASPAVTP